MYVTTAFPLCLGENSAGYVLDKCTNGAQCLSQSTQEPVTTLHKSSDINTGLVEAYLYPLRVGQLHEQAKLLVLFFVFRT